MSMPDSNSKRRWDEKNTIVFPVKLMRRTEPDLVEFLDKMLARGVGRCTMVKIALREYMTNHPEEE